MRVVLDPNVLVSAAISAGGPPRQILAAWADGRFDLIVSPTLLGELRDVLGRPRLRRWISAGSAADFVRGIEESALTAEDASAVERVSPDPDDDYLIALARIAGAAYVVSGDRHLLGLSELEPPVLSPREFISVLGDIT